MRGTDVQDPEVNFHYRTFVSVFSSRQVRVCLHTVPELSSRSVFEEYLSVICYRHFQGLCVFIEVQFQYSACHLYCNPYLISWDIRN